jgi:prevent-host-death family protein
MRVANLSDVKNDLSRYVDHVKRGGRVRILVRGLPAADIVPVEDEPAGWSAEEDDLERRGLIRRGKPGVARELLRAGPRVNVKRLRRALDDERGDRAIVR